MPYSGGLRESGSDRRDFPSREGLGADPGRCGHWTYLFRSWSEEACDSERAVCQDKKQDRVLPRYPWNTRKITISG